MRFEPAISQKEVCYIGMRKTCDVAFKAKVSQVAVKGEKTIAQIPDSRHERQFEEGKKETIEWYMSKK